MNVSEPLAVQRSSSVAKRCDGGEELGRGNR
jgi:hypothetical protein